MTWRKEIRLKQFLSTEDSPAIVREAARNFAERLKRESDYEEFGLDDFNVIVDEFEGIADSSEPDVDEFNDVLAQLYDWADRERVWIA
jgi:hypothetical protein